MTSSRAAVLMAVPLFWGAAPLAPPPPSAEWFQQQEQRLMDAVAKGDKAVWAGLLADDYVLTSEEGEVLPRQKLLDQFGPLPPGLEGSIAVKDLTVQAYPDAAVVRYRAEEHETVFGQRLATNYRVTDVYRRQGERWLIVASHTSVVTADPPAQPVPAGALAGLEGTYRLSPAGWTFTVSLRDGVLYGARNTAAPRRFIPLTPDAFVLEGTLGEWLFVRNGGGPAARIVNLRKFEPLVWTRVEAVP